jgi:HEAT repeat protein
MSTTKPRLSFQSPGTLLSPCLLVAQILVAQVLVAQNPVPPAPPIVLPRTSTAAQNPYQLQPFHPDYPVELEYPPRSGAEYDRTRRQILRRLAENLSGAVRREAWQLATEFYWRAPEDAIEPLIETMDRAYGNAAAGDADVVRNTVEAMGKMARVEFEPALRRALLHKNPAVVQAAFASLSSCGSPDTLKELAAAFPSMDGRARDAWLRAVRMRLQADAVPLLRQAMMANYTTAVRDQVLRETLQLPPAQAAVVLRGRFEEAVGEFKAIIAGVLHAAGEGLGTVWMQEALQSADLVVLADAIEHCAIGELGVLREPLLRASTHAHPDIRLAVARTLVRVPGDDVADVFETLSAPDEPWDIRGIALRELTRRGRGKAVDVLLEELPVATGSRLLGLLNQLSAAGDPRGVPAMLERFRKAPEGEGRPFLQALAQNQSEAAARGLCTLFLEPERIVARGQSETHTTRNYIPTLLLNLRGQEQVVIDAFVALPRSDWALRALLLPTLVGIAADRKDPAVQTAALQPVRAILFDREELPQLRVQALNLLARRWLLIEDVVALRNQRHQETGGMRALIGDFLLDSF